MATTKKKRGKEEKWMIEVSGKTKKEKKKMKIDGKIHTLISFEKEREKEGKREGERERKNSLLPNHNALFNIDLK